MKERWLSRPTVDINDLASKFDDCGKALTSWVID